LPTNRKKCRNQRKLREKINFKSHHIEEGPPWTYSDDQLESKLFINT